MGDEPYKYRRKFSHICVNVGRKDSLNVQHDSIN